MSELEVLIRKNLNNLSCAAFDRNDSEIVDFVSHIESLFMQHQGELKKQARIKADMWNELNAENQQLKGSKKKPRRMRCVRLHQEYLAGQLIIPISFYL